MPETDAQVLANHKKRRGVVRASLTRLGTKLGKLEGSTDHPDTLDHAKRLGSIWKNDSTIYEARIVCKRDDYTVYKLSTYNASLARVLVCTCYLLRTLTTPIDTVIVLPP